jgi:hypothetical protein
MRRMESGGILGLYEIQIELGLPLEVPRGAQLGVALASRLARLQVVDQIHQRVHRDVTQREVALLNILDARLQFVLRPFVAGLARAVDFQQRAVDVMVADLQRPLALVGHVAIGAGHARARVDALVL